MLNQWKFVLSRALLLSLPFVYGNVNAAKPVDLNDINANSFAKISVMPQSQFIETKRSVDFNQTMHVRFNQTYLGYPVWGAEGILHIPHGSATVKSFAMLSAKAETMNGTIYQDLASDIPATLTTDKTDAAKQQAISTYLSKLGTKVAISDTSTETVVYIDKANKAHWAYVVKFNADAAKDGELPAQMIYIMDAASLTVYDSWNNIQTMSDVAPPKNIPGGGYGGNIKMGKLTYDGADGDLASLVITRDVAAKKCYLKNTDVTVLDYKTHQPEVYACKHADPQHNRTLWDGELDAVNDGYSPGNDALFGGAVIKNMYRDWYNLDVLTKSDGTPMLLTMVVHDPIGDNAYWDGSKMSFGDGRSYFYPLTSLGVAAHEISHGFTQQHSNLYYSRQSGGMNEAFSDMAAQAAEVFAYGKNSWQIGPEIFKAKDQALRYMDQPSKDCRGKTPGSWCSIDTADQYYDGLDVHFSSGVYNHLFYILGTSEGWTTRQAFDVMVKANTDYWTSTSTFDQGACGVISAAKDYQYDVKSVVKALKAVKIDVSKCKSKA